ncbi:fibronectin type III domain-containing protein [Pontiellaceae bacterium B1224]|nr:fibronectin type III domain-containing protein [Pontiellaceae bacterium B1224]
MKKWNSVWISSLVALIAVQTATAQFVTNNLQDEASVLTLFNQNNNSSEAYWGFSADHVITVRNPTNLTETIQRTNFLAGASTMSSSTMSDAGEGRSTLYTQFGSYSAISWKAHIAVETPPSGDPSQNYLFFGMGQSPDSSTGDRAFIRMQYGAGGAGIPRFYVNSSVQDSWPTAITSPGTDIYITHNVDTGIMVAEFDSWAGDGTRNDGVDFVLVADVSSLSFNGDATAGLFFTAQSTVTFSDFWVQEYVPTAPSVPLNLYAWPDSNNVVSVYWDAESLSESYNVYRSLNALSNYTQVATGVMDTRYVDTDVTNGFAYYYKVAGVNAFGEGDLSNSEYAIPYPQFIIGTDASQADKSKYELFDGDIDTLFGLDAAGYAGLDYGVGNEQQLVQIRYYLRNDAWGNYDGGLRALIRSAGCMFQGANSEDFRDAETLFTLTTNNTVMGEWNEIILTNPPAFRYVRFQSGGSFNKINTMAELEFLTTADFTSAGTRKSWLDAYYDIGAEFGGDYEAADASDTDGDSILAWEENVCGTVPTNAASVLAFTSGSNTVDGLILTWQSVEGKSYSIVTNTSLTIPTAGVAVSNIMGFASETSYTTTVSGASSLFYEVGVE